MQAIHPDWQAAAVALVIGSAGAALFWVIGFPAALLTGPASAVSIATIMGVRCVIPPALRDGVFLLIGVSIGSTVTPEVIATAMAWPLSLAVLLVTLILPVPIYAGKPHTLATYLFCPLTSYALMRPLPFGH